MLVVLSMLWLQVASCLGASFSPAALSLVFEEPPMSLASDDETVVSSSVSDTVKMFEDEGLWESESDGTYRFAHDQIQSAAFQLVPSELRDRVKGDIGGILMSKLDREMLEKSFFEIVSLLNCAAPSLSEEERLDLAQMNVQAGLKVCVMVHQPY